MTPFQQWQIEKHGNFIGSDGLPHLATDTDFLTDEDLPLENGADNESINFSPIQFEA